ncbi:LysR family transcriptional regulator [Shewanella goraebulensis]|uniref:LysR family transcriptional regulator n=1 Tax=Shewanella goraebulensis TaxID=3050637 RepID=UPI0025507940|nr:LysR family transcriptional regulator [Shewanella goraebulensis]
MNFSLEQLQAFVIVYEEQSISKAAIKLNKHRTTVGQVISNLEDQVAVILFERGARKVTPTHEGSLLYHYAKQALEQVKTFDKVALSLSYGELDSITIAYNSFIPHTALSLIRAQLTSDFPNMRVRLLVRTQQEIRAGIEDESIHFGIVNITNASAMSNLDYVLLGQMPFAPYVNRNSDIAKLDSNEVFTALQSSKQIILKSFLDENMAKKITLSPHYDVVDQLSLAIKLVNDNLGWALLPKHQDHANATNNLLQIQCPQISDDYYVPLALWSLKTKPIIEVKKSIKEAFYRYTSLGQHVQ